MLRAVAGVGLCLAAVAAQNGVPAPAPASASAAGEAHPVKFDFEMPGLPVPHWSIEINADGAGRYVEASPGGVPARPIRVGDATFQRVEAGFGKASAGACEAHLKHLANSGTKTISYRSGGGSWVTCTFNYSEDKGLMDAARAFQAIAETLQQGDQLQHSHRFDRLGLDAEIDALTKEVAEGQAIEIQNIAPVLQEIVQDEHVMDRVRRKSGRLLQDAGLGLGSDRPPMASDADNDPALNAR
jgi:hypothetical protein